MGPATLAQVLQPFHKKINDPNLLVGFEGFDDAAVYRLNARTGLIQTLDFFTPMVDDPYTFGQIAAANSLSDVYAMGGKPLLAMNIVCFPSCLPSAVLTDILQGGLEKVEEAGALLVGGHTVEDNEPKYGLAVVGTVQPDRIITNAGAQDGDLLYLTKPIGSGVLSTALKAELIDEKVMGPCIESMRTLNKNAAEAMQRVGVHGCTDITGFGLLGHLREMAAASGLLACIYVQDIPVFPGTLELAAQGILPAGLYRNRDFLREAVHISPGVKGGWRDLLFDPQTSGGMLLAVSPEKAETLEKNLENKGVAAARIGEMKSGEAGKIHVYQNWRESQVFPLG